MKLRLNSNQLQLRLDRILFKIDLIFIRNLNIIHVSQFFSLDSFQSPFVGELLISNFLSLLIFVSEVLMVFFLI